MGQKYSPKRQCKFLEKFKSSKLSNCVRFPPKKRNDAEGVKEYLTFKRILNLKLLFLIEKTILEKQLIVYMSLLYIKKNKSAQKPT